MGTPSRWDIVFLMTGKPAPAVLDMAFFAQNAGMSTLMIVLERGDDDLIIDQALVNFTIETINVPYQTVDLKRLTSIPWIYWQIRALIVPGLAPEGTIVTSSYDLLLLAWLLGLGRKYKLKHRVRDLHRLQLSGSLVSAFLVRVEQFLLKRVTCVIVSSPEFRDQYYRRIYRGRTVLLENLPAKLTWANFQREVSQDGCFRIGYIGIIRYRKSLLQLIEAVKILAAAGVSLKVVFAGGGNVDELLEDVEGRDQLFEVLGPYEYTRDITRLYRKIDLIYAVYDSYDLNCQLAMPNKFYESIISKIPILVAKNTFVEREVLRLGIGAAVMPVDVEGLVDLLRVATESRDWYADALTRLHSSDAAVYFDAYDKAMRESVLL